jgi:hypothetical protein
VFAGTGGWDDTGASHWQREASKFSDWGGGGRKSNKDNEETSSRNRYKFVTWMYGLNNALGFL